MSHITVLAMGGNSIIDPALPPTVNNQFALTSLAMVPVAELIAGGERLVLTHGNGPQVGFMLMRVELARGILHDVALDSLVADTQGALGYMIQRVLREELGRRRVAAEIASIVTEIVVAPDDPAFQHPDKPIGKFYTAEEAAQLEAQHGWKLVEDAHRGYRRVVVSPQPLEIVQLPTIRRLVEAGVVVIACGGGGIPIVNQADGQVRGVEGVIDKDRASALLAVQLGATRLLITTGVDYVYANFRQPDQRALRDTTAAELRALQARKQFPAGSMGPKVEAALYFVEHGGEEVIICRPEELIRALSGEVGTRIRA